MEQKALNLIRRYADRKAKLADVLEAVLAYESLMPNRKDHSVAYARTLKDRPWEKCECGICNTVGVEVIIFRGSERNKRRGFHNLAVFRQRMNQLEIPRAESKL